MKNCLFIAVMILFGGVHLCAQDFFFPSKDGMTLCYDYCDHQGKLREYVHHTVMQTSLNDRELKITYRGERFSPDMTLLHTEEFSSEQSANGFLLGNNKDLFSSLSSTGVTQTGSEFVFKTTRTLSVKAGSFACYEHEFKSNDFFHQHGIKPFHYKVWLAKDVGIVKIEGYDTRGRRESYMELVEIKQMTPKAPTVINLQTQVVETKSTPVVINLQSQETAPPTVVPSAHASKTGDTPYAYCYGDNKKCRGTGCSQIKVITPSNSDVLVTLKQNDQVVAHSYIRANSSYTFDVPNGTYQPFFYYGSDWDAEKTMKQTGCGTLRGGFTQSEHFGKDSPQKLNNNLLTYELILQQNGNFSTAPSNRDEAL